MGQERFQSSEGRARKVSAGAHDRRRAHRYPVVEDRARLGWWEGPEFRNAAAHLINISQAGALLIADARPPAEVPLWICLVGSPVCEWVEARSAAIKAMRRGWFEIRLVFRGSCPYTLFQPAVYGFEALQPFQGQVETERQEPDGW